MKDQKARDGLVMLENKLDGQLQTIKSSLPHLRHCSVCECETYHISERVQHPGRLILSGEDGACRDYTDIHACLRCNSRFEDETTCEQEAVLITNPDYPRCSFDQKRLVKK